MPTAAPLRMPWAGAWADAVPDPDGDLLRRYVTDRDASAFAVLVRRYGPLVFGVCLRSAGQRQDAEDAFQAVFLILAQKAEGITRPHLLGNWLYGVAFRVARKARRTARRRQVRESVMNPLPRPTDSTEWAEAAPVIDDELNRLADHYRSAVLLCDVQGLSRTDAAKRLGIPEGTLSSRLNAGRKKLAERLTKRGVTLSVGVIGTLLADHATAAVPDELTARLGTILQHVATGETVGGPVGELMHEGITMRTKLWAGLMAVGLGAGVTFAAWPGGDAPKDAPPKAAKADEPKADEKGKGDATRKRARLIKTHEIPKQVTGLTWMPDGKRLLLPMENESRVLEVTSKPEATVIVEASKVILGSRHTFAGIAPSGQPITLSTSGGRVNAENAIQFWKYPTMWEKPTIVEYVEDRSISLDVEPTRILGGSANGKYLLAEVLKPVQSNGEPNNQNVNVNDWDKGTWMSHWFVRIDAQTGEVNGEVAKFDDPETRLVASATAKSADRLFVQLHTRTETQVRAIDTTTGKTIWEKSFDRVPFLRDNGQLIASADGSTLFVRQSDFIPPPPVVRGGGGGRAGGAGPGFGGGGMGVGAYNLTNSGSGWLINGRPAATQIPMILDAKTGDRKKTLDTADLPFVYLEAVSPDGKLAVGTVTAPPSPPADDVRDGRGGWGGGGFGGQASRSPAVERLVVWNTATGKTVKEWDLGGQRSGLFAAFAPDRPVLAIAEVQVSYDYSKDERGNQVNTTKYNTVVGLWDVAGLAD